MASPGLLPRSAKALGVANVTVLVTGGQKTVALADGPKGRTVVKLVELAPPYAATALERARREVAVLAAVSHPNVVRVESGLVEIGSPVESFQLPVEWSARVVRDDLSRVWSHRQEDGWHSHRDVRAALIRSESAYQGLPASADSTSKTSENVSYSPASIASWKQPLNRLGVIVHVTRYLPGSRVKNPDTRSGADGFEPPGVRTLPPAACVSGLAHRCLRARRYPSRPWVRWLKPMIIAGRCAARHSPC
jgi:hypothetical protein